jgi:hypothetical protein
MTTCPKCNTEWEPHECRLRLCRSCRRDLPVRRVNLEPLDRRYMRHLWLDRARDKPIDLQRYKEWRATAPNLLARRTCFLDWRINPRQPHTK